MVIDWPSTLRPFTRARADLIESRELLRRADTKFVMPEAAAATIVSALATRYAVLAAGDTLVASYHTLYFDTTDVALFDAHRRGRRIRQKVRVRHYRDRRVTFLEVKTRAGAGETAKVRCPRAYGESLLTADDLAFVGRHVHVGAPLVPQVWVDFSRVTLLGLDAHERVTVDFGLKLTGRQRAARIPSLAIVEVKQPRLDRRTPAMAGLRTAGRREAWASKYCIGIALTRPDERTAEIAGDVRAFKEAAAWVS